MYIYLFFCLSLFCVSVSCWFCLWRINVFTKPPGKRSRCFFPQPSQIRVLSGGVSRFCKMSSVYSQLKRLTDRLTDRQTNRQTDRIQSDLNRGTFTAQRWLKVWFVTASYDILSFMFVIQRCLIQNLSCHRPRQVHGSLLLYNSLSSVKHNITDITVYVW